MASRRVWGLDAEEHFYGVVLANAKAGAARREDDGGCERKVGIHRRAPNLGRRAMVAGHSLK